MSEKSKHYYSCLDLQYAKDDNSYVKKKIKCKKRYQKQRLTVEYSAKIIHAQEKERHWYCECTFITKRILVYESRPPILWNIPLRSFKMVGE